MQIFFVNLHKLFAYLKKKSSTFALAKVNMSQKVSLEQGSFRSPDFCYMPPPVCGSCKKD